MEKGEKKQQKGDDDEEEGEVEIGEDGDKRGSNDQ